MIGLSKEVGFKKILVKSRANKRFHNKRFQVYYGMPSTFYYFYNANIPLSYLHFGACAYTVAIRTDIERKKKVKVNKISIYNVWTNFKLEKLKVRTKEQFIYNVYIIIKANVNSLLLRSSTYENHYYITCLCFGPEVGLS